MKKVGWILAAMSLGLVAACSAPTESSSSDESQDSQDSNVADKPEVGVIKLYRSVTTYTGGGRCIINQCDPTEDGCTGSETGTYRTTTNICGYR